MDKKIIKIGKCLLALNLAAGLPSFALPVQQGATQNASAPAPTASTPSALAPSAAYRDPLEDPIVMRAIPAPPASARKTVSQPLPSACKGKGCGATIKGKAFH